MLHSTELESIHLIRSFKLILVTAFVDAWKRPFDYKGVTSRKNYWFYLISVFLVNILFGILKGISSNLAYIFEEIVISNFFIVIYKIITLIDSLYALGLLIIAPSIIVRRLRDAGKQWQWMFLLLIPFIGWIWLIVLYCQPTKSQNTNNYSNKNDSISKEKRYYRNIGIYKKDDLKVMEDNQVYEIIKLQLLGISNGEIKSEAGEIEYLKNILNDIQKSK